jgi:hypothetical protein
MDTTKSRRLSYGEVGAMPTQRTLDIWLTIERVDCPVCKARQDTPCRRLYGGEKNRYKNNNAHKARIVTAKRTDPILLRHRLRWRDLDGYANALSCRIGGVAWCVSRQPKSCLSCLVATARCWQSVRSRCFVRASSSVPARAHPRPRIARVFVEYIAWYGSTRHGTLGYRSPAGFENGRYDTIKNVAVTGLSVRQSGNPCEAGRSLHGGRGGR